MTWTVAAATPTGTAQRITGASESRLPTQTRVTRAQLLAAAGEREAARELLVAANRWYAEAGAGEGAEPAAELLESLEASPAR